MTRPQRIGFIGLGMMGTPMVQCLAKAGFELLLADADASRTDALAKEIGAARRGSTPTTLLRSMH
jgi:3-hydroxyisobutyrate dehydrogenase